MKFHDDVHLTSGERELLGLVEQSLDSGELVEEPYRPRHRLPDTQDNWVASASGAILAASGGMIIGAAVSTPITQTALLVLLSLGLASLVAGMVAAVPPLRRLTADSARRTGTWWCRVLRRTGRSLRHPAPLRTLPLRRRRI